MSSCLGPCFSLSLSQLFHTTFIIFTSLEMMISCKPYLDELSYRLPESSAPNHGSIGQVNIGQLILFCNNIWTKSANLLFSQIVWSRIEEMLKKQEDELLILGLFSFLNCIFFDNLLPQLLGEFFPSLQRRPHFQTSY